VVSSFGWPFYELCGVSHFDGLKVFIDHDQIIPGPGPVFAHQNLDIYICIIYPYYSTFFFSKQSRTLYYVTMQSTKTHRKCILCKENTENYVSVPFVGKSSRLGKTRLSTMNASSVYSKRLQWSHQILRMANVNKEEIDKEVEACHSLKRTYLCRAHFRSDQFILTTEVARLNVGATPRKRKASSVTIGPTRTLTKDKAITHAARKLDPEVANLMYQILRRGMEIGAERRGDASLQDLETVEADAVIRAVVEGSPEEKRGLSSGVFTHGDLLSPIKRSNDLMADLVEAQAPLYEKTCASNFFDWKAQTGLESQAMFDMLYLIPCSDGRIGRPTSIGILLKNRFARRKTLQNCFSRRNCSTFQDLVPNATMSYTV
jgi:hypothetical protein